MNIFDIISQTPRPKRTRLNEPNSANTVASKLAELYPTLTNHRFNVVVTGSTVWKLVLDGELGGTEDLDLIVPDEIVRASVIQAMQLEYVRDCEPGYPAELDNRTGKKYKTPDNKTVDIWTDNTLSTFRWYPEESHGHCRMGFNLATHVLSICPNPYG